MPNKASQQSYFVEQALRHALTQDAHGAALWFRQHKAWRMSTAQALRAFAVASTRPELVAQAAAQAKAPSPCQRPPACSAALLLQQAGAALRLLCAALESAEHSRHRHSAQTSQALAAAARVLCALANSPPIRCGTDPD